MIWEGIFDMASTVKHMVSIYKGSDKSLVELLKSDGILSHRTVYRYNRDNVAVPKVHPEVFDMAKCDEDLVYEDIDMMYRKMRTSYHECDPEYKELFDKGWEVDTLFIDNYHLRMKWDEHVLESLALQPVWTWGGAILWTNPLNEKCTPIIALQLKYPDIVFEHTVTMDDYIMEHTLEQNNLVIDDLLVAVAA